MFTLLLNFIFCLTSENTIYSLFWLVTIFFNSFFLLFILNIKIISILILIIYVGAVAILFLFSIMILNFNKKNNITNSYIYFFLPIIISYLYFINITDDFNLFYNKYLNWSVISYNNLTFEIGYLLYYDFFFYLIISSFILFIPMVIIIILI